MEETIEDRCKHYGTTLNGCTCMGYIYRKKCKHLSFMVERESKIIEVVAINDGMDIEIAVERYGEEKINRAISAGKLLFNRQV